MPAGKKQNIKIGIGGWVYEDWRGTFYPAGLPQKRELEFASGQLSTIEINGTYYGSQKPESFARWYSETPKGFIFSLKGPRFATNRRVLADAGESVGRFLSSGITELKEKLGPINWQFMPTKKFDAADFESFLKLLPKKMGNQSLRHAVEVRHESFATPEFIELVRKYGVAIVIEGDSAFPQIADLTAPFVYARIMGTSETEKLGYSRRALDAWTKRAKLWADGKEPPDLPKIMPKTKSAPSMKRDVFIYVISGFKALNPAAAMAMLEQLD